jgi:hypothetical protein
MTMNAYLNDAYMYVMYVCIKDDVCMHHCKSAVQDLLRPYTYVCGYVCMCPWWSGLATSVTYVRMYACMNVYVCMFVCMYVWLSRFLRRTYSHARMYACMYVSMYVCMYACMHVSMYVCMSACLMFSAWQCLWRPHMYVCMHMCACIFVCM